jgi:hypothetical protein
MLVGDFNGDGKPDLIIMDDYSTGFQVLLGKGDGTFQAPVDTKLNTSLTFAIGDFNGDGKTDVVVTTSVNAQAKISIYLSNGDGTFRLSATYMQYYGGVNVADVNGDGKLDLVFIGFGEPLLVMLGDGDGTFQKAISGPTAIYSGEAVIRDFDGDGKSDIAVGTYNGVAFLKGNGDGSFQSPVYSNPTIYFCCEMVAADVNGDGKLDLVFNQYQTVFVMLGKGNGTFQPPDAYGANGQIYSGNIVVGDFNSDGVSDIGIVNQDSYSGATVASLYLSIPAIDLFPTSANFGAEQVGKTSLPATIYVRNVGNAKLSISSIIVTGDSFIEQTTCAKGLAIGGLCTIKASFKPIAKGKLSGKITIHDNTTASPQVIYLQGTGQ